MSEREPDPSAGVSPPAPEPSHGGALLREAREAAGLHVAALAVALKVPVRHIEALEQGAFDRLPDATFTRALAGSVCRHLHLDPQPVLARLPQVQPQTPRSDAGINTPFHRPGDGTPVGLRAYLRRPAVLVALALLLGALGLLVVPGLWPPASPEPAASAPQPTAESTPPRAPSSAPSDVSTVPPALSVPASSAGTLAGRPGVVIESVRPALPPAYSAPAPASNPTLSSTAAPHMTPPLPAPAAPSRSTP